MHAQKLRRRESCFELGPDAVHEVRCAAGVKLHVVVRCLDPVDLVHVQEADALHALAVERADLSPGRGERVAQAGEPYRAQRGLGPRHTACHPRAAQLERHFSRVEMEQIPGACAQEVVGVPPKLHAREVGRRPGVTLMVRLSRVPVV